MVVTLQQLASFHCVTVRTEVLTISGTDRPGGYFAEDSLQETIGGQKGNRAKSR